MKPNINSFMNGYGGDHMNMDSRTDTGHPFYMAGFKEGRAYEADRIAADIRKERPSLKLNVSVTDTELFKDILEITRELGQYLAEDGNAKGLQALVKLSDLLEGRFYISDLKKFIEDKRAEMK